MSPQPDPTHSPRNRGLALLILVAVFAYAFWAASDRGQEQRTATAPTGPEGWTRVEGPVAEPIDLDSTGPDTPGDPTGAQREATPLKPQTILCLSDPEGIGLAGVQAYLVGEPVAGPSDQDGVLILPGPELESPLHPWDKLTFWIEGHLPVSIRVEDIPSEVRLRAVRTGLEVRLINGSSQHTLLRSLLQPRGADGLAGAPWIPSLEGRAPDLWVAQDAPPGQYDLYLWVTYPNGAVRSFSQVAFEIELDRTTKLTFDLARPLDQDDFESDS